MMWLLANWIHYKFHVSKFNHIINGDLRVSRKTTLFWTLAGQILYLFGMFGNLYNLDHRYTTNFVPFYLFVDSIARYIYDIHDNQTNYIKCIEFSRQPLYKWNIVYYTIIIAPEKVQNGLNNTIACVKKIRIRRNYQEYNCVVKLIKRKIR